MKKTFKALILFLIIQSLLFTCIACNSYDRYDDEDDYREDKETEEETTSETITEETPPVTDVIATPEIKTFTVTFNLNGGTLISGELTQVIEEGKAATAPATSNGHKSLKWDKDFSNITSDITVNAVWEKVALSDVELASLGQKATVTIEVETITGGVGRGSGFFIDNNGTLITAFHVIESAANISVIAGNGGSYPLEKVISFNPIYDIAIIKIDYESKDYLEICNEDATVGESVVAVGSALGSLSGTCTYGHISSVKRTVGKIECIQTDAAISSGNSGGPLLNVYGEVVGMNCFSYVRGENLNLAVKMSMFDRIGDERNYSMSEMKRWYNTEASRSYSPYDDDYNFHYSIVNNYDTVTGVKCYESWDFYGDDYYGYHDMMMMYFYEYDVNSYDKYVKYLLDQGFVYDDTENESGFYIETYINEKDNYEIQLMVYQASSILVINMFML